MLRSNTHHSRLAHVCLVLRSSTHHSRLAHACLILRSSTNHSFAACLIVNANESGLPPPCPHSQCCCSTVDSADILNHTWDYHCCIEPSSHMNWLISHLFSLHFFLCSRAPLLGEDSPSEVLPGMYLIEHLCVIMYLHFSCLHVHLFCLIFENMTTWPIRLAWSCLFASAGPSLVPPQGVLHLPLGCFVHLPAHYLLHFGMPRCWLCAFSCRG